MYIMYIYVHYVLCALCTLYIEQGLNYINSGISVLLVEFINSIGFSNLYPPSAWLMWGVTQTSVPKIDKTQHRFKYTCFR